MTPSSAISSIDEDIRRVGKTMVAEISQRFPGNDNINIYCEDKVSTDNDDDECCPICYELFLVSSSLTTTAGVEDEVSGLAIICTGEDSETLVSECSCCGYVTNDGTNDGEEDICHISIDVDVKRHHQQLASLRSASRNSNKCSHAEDQRAPTHPTSCTGHRSSCHRHQDRHHSMRCHPRGKVAIPGCGHGFCRGCLKDHCSYAISVRDLPIRCPKFLGDGSGRPCSVVLPIDLVKESLLMQDATNKDWIKFQRLHRMSEEPSLIPCTRCDELIFPNHTSKHGNNNSNNNKDERDDRSSGDPNRIHCPACQHVFCRIHGDGHLGKDCTDTNLRDCEDPSEKVILELCKPCSHCRVPICREEGCNHIVCPICKNDMCFKCGTHKHLQNKGRTVRICKGCRGSYLDHRYLGVHRLGVLAKLPFMLPIYVGYMAMTMALALATCGCFCCLGCGVRYKTKKPKEQNPTKQHWFDRPSKTIVWMPLLAIREVLGWLLLPFIDVFRECRFPCCFCHNAPGLCRGTATDDDEEDDDDEEEGDVENQMRRA
jgi:hypothetical protein